VASLNERVTNLESQSDKHAATIAALRTDIADLRLELRTDLAAVRGEMATLRGDMALRSETAELRREIAGVRGDMATRTDIADVRREIADLRAEVRGQFLWLAGAMITGFVAVIGALIGVVYLQMVSS
jgi:VIT1/CCC1 family predicted Fe2+/Mn2+ transporter